jgi:hypothetical protein
MTGYEQNDHGDVDNLTKFVDHVFEMGREDISTYPPVAPALEHAMIDFAAMLDEA